MMQEREVRKNGEKELRVSRGSMDILAEIMGKFSSRSHSLKDVHIAQVWPVLVLSHAQSPFV